MAKPHNSAYATAALLVAGALLLSSVLLPQNGQQTTTEQAPQSQTASSNTQANSKPTGPAFTQDDVRDALSFQERILLNVANHAAMFYTQTDNFPVRVADLTSNGENLWDGPYLAIDSPNHNLDLIWGQSPDAPVFEVCGVDPIFMADCFLWISASNIPPAWFKVYDTYLDAGDGVAAGQARYDEEAQALIIEMRALTIAPENGSGFSISDTDATNEDATPSEDTPQE